MHAFTLIKKLAAVLLMICFVLPLSRCEHSGKIDLKPATNASAPVSKPVADPVYEDKYAYQNVVDNDPVAGALTIAAFFWPMLVFLFGARQSGRRLAIATNLAELALCGGSAYMIYGITFFGELRYGGYLAFIAIGAYFLSALAQLMLRLFPRLLPGLPRQ